MIAGIFFALLSFVVPVIILVAVIALVIYLVKTREDKHVLGVQTFLKLYLYAAMAVSLAVTVIGLGISFMSLSSYILGPEFSYSLNSHYEYDSTYKYNTDYDYDECYDDGEVIEVDGEKYCFNNEQRKRDFLLGMTLFISMFIIFVIHRVGLAVSSKKEKSHFLKKLYMFVSVSVYGIASIVAIPLSLYTLIDYLAFEIKDYSSYSRPIPGQIISFALVLVPVWIYFLVRLTLAKDKGQETSV